MSRAWPGRGALVRRGGGVEIALMRAFTLVPILLAASCQSSVTQAPAFDGPRALRWVEHQVSAGARVPNTPAHRAIGEWLVQELRQRADTVVVQDFVHVTVQGDTLRLRNIFARFRPADPSRILYVSHWDSRPRADSDPLPANRNLPVPGAVDGAASTAMLLGVADALKRNPPGIGVDLLFVDGEDYGEFPDTDVLIGSSYFARNMPPGYAPLFAVVWDLIGDAAQQFGHEALSLERSPEVVERVWRAAEEIGLGRVFRNTRVGPINDDHVPLIHAGIRAINVIASPFPPYWHTTADTPDKVSVRSLQQVGSLALHLIRM
jgi:glutaminyl-peptide cyclotransferase